MCIPVCFAAVVSESSVMDPTSSHRCRAWSWGISLPQEPARRIGGGAERGVSHSTCEILSICT